MENNFSEIEIGLLGSIIIGADECLEEVLTEITADNFLSPSAKRIWGAIYDLHNEGQKIDPYTVKARAGEVYQSFVDNIVNVVPTAANWKAYLHELKRKSKLIMAEQIAKDIHDDALAEVADVDDLREKAEHLCAVLENSDAIKNEYTAHELAVQFIQEFDNPREYLHWGMDAINKTVLCEQGDYVLLGATPSTGKTALAAQFMVNLAKSGKRVLFFSYETTAKKLMDRIESCFARVPYDNIRRGTCTMAERRELVAAAREISKLPFQIIECGGYTVEDIRSKVIKHKADVIFIDYIQQIGHRNQKLTEYQRITEVSRGIQTLCKKYKVTTVALSQFSRFQDDKKPTIHSFRSSGQLEQDADFAILFYRPEKLEEGMPDTDRVFDIAKSKDGRVTKIRMYFEGEYQTFSVVDYDR